MAQGLALKATGFPGFVRSLPEFPNTLVDQTLDNWLAEVERYDFDEETIAIGHSLGATFLLNLLERRKLKTVYLVAGFVGLLNNEYDEVIHTFSDREFDWELIRAHCKNFHILYADDDPLVLPQKAFELGEKLKTEPTLIEGAGHFGFFTFEDLYSDMISEIPD